jgi:hypothetical protein
MQCLTVGGPAHCLCYSTSMSCDVESAVKAGVWGCLAGNMGWLLNPPRWRQVQWFSFKLALRVNGAV